MSSWRPFRRPGLGNRIQAALVEGVAAADAAQAQPAAAQDAKTFHRLHGVLRARGMEAAALAQQGADEALVAAQDRKSTRLNSSHVKISYAVFCLKKK